MIRQCTIEDLSELKEISYVTFDETFRPQNKKENIDAYLSTAFTSEKILKELENPHSYFYFIYYQNNLAGYLKVNVEDAQTEEMKGKSLEIERIYVLSRFQKHGLGKQLFNQVLDLAQEMNRNKLWLGVWEKNANAIRFYEKLGFQQIDEHAFYMGDDRQIDIIMSKSLKG
ncbi:GNAT family N-acetyltransferase [Salinicoccus hispanicus]|uniref:GNAT family N-acetyltransferase n=1 Tax=Salinicoccus hispanicus TaxID=157225 RepID=A0A6N8U1R9_9STAP|nr:GNAT family N-acetyltransferase [Salinicoccus hispanicus]MXQ52040.1 GNAT family N-acetyltransferase [Salinicoccus hispanicus]